MSGIAGIFYPDGRPVDPVLLKRIEESVAHRGPDGIRHWLDGPVGLIHLAFHTTPESLYEAQPLANEDDSLRLTMDGRVDNRKELRMALESQGFRLRDESDAELVIRAYECWGEDCPGLLLGDFAFAVWDKRNRQLFCARDQSGVRPFYYHSSPSTFVFGSELRAVLALPTVPRRLNESRLVDYLFTELDREDKESTFYQDVLRLPGGHCLTVADGRFLVRDYWRLKAPPTLRLTSFREYGEAFREVFTDAVRCRLRSVQPVGSTLSGGLDSSSVVCVIRELLSSELKEPLRTISLVDADESRCRETPYIREILQGGRVIPRIVRSDEVQSFCGGLQEAMIDSDEPFDIAQCFFDRVVFSAARDCGVGVLLDGVPGDLVIPNQYYLASLLRTLDWRSAAAELSYFSRRFGQSHWSTLKQWALVPMMPKTYLALRRLAHWLGVPSLPKDTLIDMDFAVRMGVLERREQRFLRLAEAARDIDELHSRSFTSGLVPFAYEIFNRLAAATGIEVRHPFADRRVIEFFLSLPLRMKLCTPYPKMVIRAAMEGVLPERVRLRQEFGHAAPAFTLALLRYEADLVKIILDKDLESLATYVNLDGARKAYHEYGASRSADAAWEVWQVVNLAVWMNARNLAAGRAW